VTAKIVKELETGRCPWAQLWRARESLSSNDATIAAGLPKNAQTGRAYSGIKYFAVVGRRH